MKKVAYPRYKTRCPYCGCIQTVTVSATYGYQTCTCKASWCLLPDNDVIGELIAYSKLYRNEDRTCFLKGRDFFAEPYKTDSLLTEAKTILWIK